MNAEEIALAPSEVLYQPTMEILELRCVIRLTMFSLRKRRTGSLKVIMLRRCPIFYPKSSEQQKKGHHVRRCPIVHPKSNEKQKKKVITSAGCNLS